MSIVIMAVFGLALFGGWLWAEIRGGKVLRISLALVCMLAVAGGMFAAYDEILREYRFRASLRGDIPPSKELLVTIQKSLAGFAKTQTWSGERWAGVRGDGSPVSAGPWQIETVATEKEGVFELRGITLGEPRSVQLDLSKGFLTIDGETFYATRAVWGKYRGLGDTPYQGARFERPDSRLFGGEGNFYGAAAILLLEDGRAVVDFHGARAQNGLFPTKGESGVLSPARGAD